MCFILIIYWSQRNKKNRVDNNTYLEKQLDLLRGSKDKINILHQTINILNGIIDTISNKQQLTLEVKKNKLILELQDFIDYIKTNELYEELAITEETINKLKRNIIGGKTNSTYNTVELFINDKIKIIREKITQTEKQFIPSLEEYELNNQSFLKVKQIFDNLNISNQSKYFTSQYFETIDENITGYYNIVTRNSNKNIILQTHFFDDILDNPEYSDLFYDYIYVLYKPKLQKLIRNDNITQEEEELNLNKQYKKEFLSINKRLSIREEDYIQNKKREYYEEKESKLKNDIIQYLKEQYAYNTKILQQINKSKKDYNNILTPKNTTIWYVQLQFDIEKTYNINAIDKIQKPLKQIDSKDTYVENCNKSKQYFESSWVNSIDNQFYNLVHDDPQKLKLHFQNFRTYLSNLF